MATNIRLKFLFLCFLVCINNDSINKYKFEKIIKPSAVSSRTGGYQKGLRICLQIAKIKTIKGAMVIKILIIKYTFDC